MKQSELEQRAKTQAKIEAMAVHWPSDLSEKDKFLSFMYHEVVMNWKKKNPKASHKKLKEFEKYMQKIISEKSLER